MDASEIATACALIIAVAGAIKASLYILEKMRDGGVKVVRWWDKRRQTRELLIRLLETEERNGNGIKSPE